MDFIRKLLSRKFNLFCLKIGRSPDLFYAISPSQLQASGFEVNSILIRGTETSSA